MNWFGFLNPEKLKEKPPLFKRNSNVNKKLYPEEQDNLRYWRGFRQPEFQRNKAKDLKVNIELEGEQEIISEALGSLTKLIPTPSPPKWQTDSDLVVLEMDSKDSVSASGESLKNKDKYSSKLDLSYEAYKRKATDSKDEPLFVSVKKFPSRTQNLDNEAQPFATPDMSETLQTQNITKGDSLVNQDCILSKGDFVYEANKFDEKEPQLKPSHDTCDSKLKIASSQDNKELENNGASLKTPYRFSITSKLADLSAQTIKNLEISNNKFAKSKTTNHRNKPSFKVSMNQSKSPGISHAAQRHTVSTSPMKSKNTDEKIEKQSISIENKEDIKTNEGIYFTNASQGVHNVEKKFETAHHQENSGESRLQNSFTRTVLTPKHNYVVRQTRSVPRHQQTSKGNTNTCEVTNAKIPVHSPDFYQNNTGIRVSLSESFQNKFIRPETKQTTNRKSDSLCNQLTASSMKLKFAKPPIPRNTLPERRVVVPPSTKFFNISSPVKTESTHTTLSKIDSHSAPVTAVLNTLNNQNIIDKELKALPDNFSTPKAIIPVDNMSTTKAVEPADKILITKAMKPVNNTKDRTSTKPPKRSTRNYQKYDNNSLTNMYFSRNPTGGGYIMKRRSDSPEKHKNTPSKAMKVLDNSNQNTNNNSLSYDSNQDRTEASYSNYAHNMHLFSKSSPLKPQNCSFVPLENSIHQSVTKTNNSAKCSRVDKCNMSAKNNPTTAKAKTKSIGGKRDLKDESFYQFFNDFMKKSFPKNMPSKRFLIERDLDSGKSLPWLGKKRNNPCHRELNKIVWCFNNRNSDSETREVAMARNNFYNCVRLNPTYFYEIKQRPIISMLNTLE